ncbi:F0F1 ATP synthase subunit epsilon [Phreatobacter aquaticus]|uniref:ATP synthase epsilon chain n=1 Tax=Phreatobacter aquaticus TaxID=2570229 RepID=A0A4D7QGB4_9HYPH|nr:F0F1 ATP synthase subunit epsilon [Phreatobacter aquaticus]QCK85751.1 F0F1 ATP synthase subunit epsilon [Phreatobacter aquaticus]
MTTFSFELVSPERQLFSGAVTQVVVPGADGEFGIFAGHAPFVSSIRPGILTIYGEGQPKRLYVRGGFAEVSSGTLTVLAEQAVAVEDLDAGQIDRDIKAAEEDLADAKSDDARSRAAEKLAQLNDVKAILATSSTVH